MVSSAVFLLLLPFAFLWVGATSGRLRALMIIFQFMFFAFQLAFLYLIYRMSEYRTTLTFLEKNQNSQESYYHELNTNLQDMENLRHDIKNLFLTMSGFVARSDDDEMKAFYREKIYPFALNEVEHNYQFSRLYEIPDETLRAFLYTKLSQVQRRTEENFKRGFPSKAFAGANIENTDKSFNCLIFDRGHIFPLRQELANEPICVLICSSCPGRMWWWEIKSETG